MKSIVASLLFLAGITQLFAQHGKPCAFDNLYKQHADQYNQANAALLKNLSNSFHKSQDSIIKTIPVVVHVIHNGGAENISTAQIESQLAALNEDFGKIQGTSGDGAGVDTRVRFILARLNPSGKCTNGIVRIKSSLSDHKTVDRDKLKNLSFWDNKRYLNIYIVKTIDNGSGTLGYSSFPGGPDDSDGIVVLYNAFGRVGNVTSPYNLGRTTTHEIGHWLGLYHTFQNSCAIDLCTDGDYVCDTPPVINPNFNCPTNVNSCSVDSPDLPDLVKNYMDYTDDACKNMLTAGQAERIHNSLITFRSQIWSDANLISTGCDSAYVPVACSVVADFTANSTEVCTGNSVLFTSKALNQPFIYKWTFVGGAPDSSITQNQSVVYNAPGLYSVKLIVFNATGNSDTLFIPNYITVTDPPIGQALPFAENFENTVFPSNGIVIDNPDLGITWLRDTAAVAYEGVAAAKINNLINTNYGQADAMILPAFDLSTFPSTPYLRFRWAYARSDANYSDQLSVLVSKDCGVNFSQIFTRSGNGLATGPTQTTPYLPDGNTVWKEAKISLQSFKTSQNVIIKIVNVTDGGNNLYIDDIKIDDLSSSIGENHDLITDINIYPNPTSGNFILKLKPTVIAPIQLSITDVTGRLVHSKTIAVLSLAEKSVPIDFEALPGIYHITLNLNGSVHNCKLSVTNKR